MASQGPNNTFNAGSGPGQAQMRRDMQNEGQNNFIQETGSHVKNMAHGATEVGKGAALGAASLARGAAQGAANVAQGAADALKNTFGMSSPENTTIGSTASTNHPSSNPSMAGSTHPNAVNIDMDQSAYPSKPSYAHTPNTGI